MGDIRFVKTLWGNAPEMDTATADEALEEGDIANFDGDSELEKIDADATEWDLVLVMEDADADQTGVQFMWIDPGVVLEGVMAGTLGDVGDLVGIDVNSNVCEFGGGGPAMFMIRKIVDATTQTIQAVRVYKDAT
jgi:hypothetical protein